MNFIAYLDSIAADIRHERQVAELAIKGVLAQFTTGPNPTSRQSRHALQSNLLRLQHKFGEEARAAIERRIKLSIEQGARAALDALGVSHDTHKLAEAAQTSWEARGMKLAESVTTNALAALKTLTDAYAREAHQFALRVQAKMDAGNPEAAAAVAVHMDQPFTPDLAIIDGAGRRQEAGRYLSLALRGAALEARNQAYMDVADAAGFHVLAVDHAEGKAGVHGLKFATRTGVAPHLPLYVEIRNDMFHPNAKSVVVIA